MIKQKLWCFYPKKANIVELCMLVVYSLLRDSRTLSDDGSFSHDVCMASLVSIFSSCMASPSTHWWHDMTSPLPVYKCPLCLSDGLSACVCVCVCPMWRPWGVVCWADNWQTSTSRCCMWCCHCRHAMTTGWSGHRPFIQSIAAFPCCIIISYTHCYLLFTLVVVLCCFTNSFSSIFSVMVHWPGTHCLTVWEIRDSFSRLLFTLKWNTQIYYLLTYLFDEVAVGREVFFLTITLSTQTHAQMTEHPWIVCQTCWLL